jgi:2'-5' RNA ligase
LRRALSAPERLRVPPHVTLVPPINVRDDELSAGVSLVTRVASELTPFTVTLGPATTFAPVTPTVHLSVTGVGTSALSYLRSSLVETAPFDRPDPHPFVPHVTLIQEMDPASGIDAAVSVLAGWVEETTFSSVHVLRHGEDRVWHPIVSAKLTK